MAIHENTEKLISLAKWRRGVFLALAVTCIMTWSLSSWAKPDDAVPYPVGYRQWAHVKSTIIGPKSSLYEKIGGIQHIYANEKGMEGYGAGRFPEGSILIYDFLKTEEDANSPGVTHEGSRRFTSVMVKDSKRYAATGGWGFEEFRGDSQTDRMIGAEAPTKCYACHTSQKDRDYVFSAFRK
ncbi:MAG TPA: cytochrome P460 family protein [Blastocatellia bacterium]|nr:cytochrome P460 family protein [Blastocatellia bacterium]